jgi:hypothetical protein
MYNIYVIKDLKSFRILSHDIVMSIQILKIDSLHVNSFCKSFTINYAGISSFVYILAGISSFVYILCVYFHMYKLLSGI